MKLQTISEYQLLFLAKCELEKRVDEISIRIANHKNKQSLRREQALLEMYRDQLHEISERMAEINSAE